MDNTLEFLKKVNQNLVSELDILNFIDEATKNDLLKLEQLYKDLETFETKTIVERVLDGLDTTKAVNNSQTISDLFVSFKKIVSDKIEKLPQTVPAPENLLNWNGTQTEFIELIKALIENGNIKGTQTEIISKLSNVFNIEIKHPNKLITDIKKRNNGSETLFLDKLQKSLLDYITLEKKK